MPSLFHELTYKNAGISVAIAHVLLALLVIFCAFNLSRKAEPILMMAQVIDRESVAITTSVHVQPKDKNLDKEKTIKDSDLVKEKTSEARARWCVSICTSFNA